jgi:outer membrane receptor protein involved in Fe transport
VQNNSGGRATFQNAGRTQRQGLELSGNWRHGPVSLVSALTWMQAEYLDAFQTCPCSKPLCKPPGTRAGRAAGWFLKHAMWAA